MTERPSDVITLQEVAEYLLLSKRTVYRLAQEGRIPAYKIGRLWRFKRSDIERWLQEQGQHDDGEER